MSSDELETRASLLGRLRDYPSEKDWQVLYDRYAPVVINFACKWGLDVDAAHDVLQETMVTLMRTLPTFAYDPAAGRFRNFVCTIAMNRIRAERRRRGHDREVSLDQPAFEGLPTPLELIEDDSVRQPGDEIDRRWQSSLWETALDRIMTSSKYKDQVKAVFCDYVLGNESPEAVAAKHGITANNVYRIKNRILRDLAAEIRRLLPESEDAVECR